MPSNLMKQAVTLFRPQYSLPGTSDSEQVTNYLPIYQNLPVNIQPVNATEFLAYAQRGISVSVNVYTNQTNNTYNYGDVLQWFDNNGVEHQFHIVAYRNLLYKNVLVVFTCEEFPSTAKKRLNTEDATQ